MENDDLTLPGDLGAAGGQLEGLTAAPVADGALPDLGSAADPLAGGLPDLGAGDGGLPDLGGGDLSLDGGLPDLGADMSLDAGADPLAAPAIDMGMEPPAIAQAPVAPAAASGVPSAAVTPPAGGLGDGDIVNIGAIHNIKVTVQAVLGGVSMPIAKLMSLKKDDVVSLDSKLGSAIDLLANGQLIARGEIVVLEDESDEEPRFGITLTEVISTTKDLV